MSSTRGRNRIIRQTRDEQLLDTLVRAREALARGDTKAAAREIEDEAERVAQRCYSNSNVSHYTLVDAESLRSLPVPTLSPVASPSSRTPP